MTTTCPRCRCNLVIQPDDTLWCANCGDDEYETTPVEGNEALDLYRKRDRA